jgi:hypothetical protein
MCAGHGGNGQQRQGPERGFTADDPQGVVEAPKGFDNSWVDPRDFHHKSLADQPGQRETVIRSNPKMKIAQIYNREIVKARTSQNEWDFVCGMRWKAIGHKLTGRRKGWVRRACSAQQKKIQIGDRLCYAMGLQFWPLSR